MAVLKKLAMMKRRPSTPWSSCSRWMRSTITVGRMAVVVRDVVGVGVVVALAAWAMTGKENVGWSAGYGALAVVIPAAIFARGLTGRFASLNPGTAAVGFMLWEMVKIALTVAMLVAAPRLVSGLIWPALLVGLVLTMKVYWLALAYSPKGKRRANEN